MMTVAQYTLSATYASTHPLATHTVGTDRLQTTVARRYEGKPEDYAVRVDDQPPVRLQDLRLRLCSAAYTEHRTVPYRTVPAWRGMAWRGMARHGMARDG